MLQCRNVIVCVLLFFHTKHTQEAATAAVTQCMARRSNPAATTRQKNDKVRFCRTGHTAGTTVLYEDRLST
ncbi:hypothetical protein FPJ27_12770 [Burkholderia sp. MS455]|nr:hypothetical protein FPJ27_12770 [Burkholderia sp. MS455]